MEEVLIQASGSLPPRQRGREVQHKLELKLGLAVKLEVIPSGYGAPVPYGTCFCCTIPSTDGEMRASSHARGWGTGSSINNTSPEHRV